MDRKVLDASNWKELQDVAHFQEVMRALREFVYRQDYRKERNAVQKAIMQRAKEEGWLKK